MLVLAGYKKHKKDNVILLGFKIFISYIKPL